MTGNFNFLLRQSKGDFICLTGGDDLFRPGRIERQLRALQENPSASLCLFTPLNAKREYLEDPRQLALANYVGGPSVMVRRSAIPPHGFDGSIPVASDWLFNLEVGIQGIIYLPDVLVDYRRSARNATTAVQCIETPNKRSDSSKPDFQRSHTSPMRGWPHVR